MLTTVLLLSAIASQKPRPLVVAYVPSWIDLAAFAPTIDYAKLTHINIAFENPINAEGDLSLNQRNKVVIDLARKHRVKVLLSIGGGSAADDKVLKPRYFDLLSDAKRARFVEKLTAYVVKHNYDGLDVDLEGPSINDNYGDFISDLAKSLKPKGKLLTSALSQGYGGDRVPKSVFAQFDFVNLMAYDGTGNWSPDRPGQHSSLEFAKSTATWWIGRGLPKEKAVLGVPFYGYGFGKAFRNYGYPYSEVVAAFPGSDQLDQVGETIWYNGIPTIKAKAKYVRDEGLAGVMIWSLDQDVKGPKSLLNALTSLP